jgi:hypothetical protein
LKRKFEQILAKGRRGGIALTDDDVGLYNTRILIAENGIHLLAYELANRRIGLTPFRDATTFRLRRSV